jgi:hypothetical protein
MPTSNSALRAELGTTLRTLQSALSALADYLRAAPRAAWCWQSPRPSHANATRHPPADLSLEQTLANLAEGIQTIKYDDAQDPHESRIYPGIVALPHEGVALADEVNRLKALLAQVLKDMDGRTVTDAIDPSTGERGERPLREVALEAFYFRRLQHWQATRRLEILRETAHQTGTLDYVGFMWATSREVRRTSREALLKEAQDDERRLSAEELEVLRKLPAGEPLALVRPGHTTPKANIRWVARDGAPPTTKVRLAVLPLIVPGEHLPERLRKLPPTPPPKRHRAARTDIEIESAPLLPTLQVYRYLPQQRAPRRRTRNL